MLKFLREHANSWIMKILLGILILSFGLFWGISEFFRGTDKSNIVASIGKIEISKQNLMHSVQEELSRLNRELKGKSITFSQALHLGLVTQNLSRMVNEIVLDMFMKHIKLSVGDKTIASLIYGDPLFQDSQGNFDKEKFQHILRANGLSEKAFFANRRRALSQMHLLTSISVGHYSPAALSYPVFQALTQKCSFLVASISGDKIQVSHTEGELKKFYEDHPEQFKIPEYRDFKLILLDPNKISARISVSEKEIRQVYEEQKENYVNPEMRSFSLVTCKDLEEAKQVRKYLHSGDLKDRSRQKNYESVGEASLDKALAQVVFKLAPRQVSEPFEWRKQVVLVKVNKIVPGTITSFNEASSQISEDLKRQKVGDEISKITAQIEEGTNQGLSLVEIAKKYRLGLQEGRIDASGRLVGGTPISLSADIVKDIFALTEGAETQLTELPDEVSYLVSVNKILPAHSESFEKVRSQVLKSLIQEKRQNEMRKIAEMVKEKLKAGQRVSHPAVSFITTPKISISEGLSKIKLPTLVVQRGFSLAKGQPDVVAQQDRSYIIVPVSIEALPIEKNLALYKAYKEDLGKSVFQSMYISLMEALKKEYKVEIYPDNIANLKE
jgi:peptidyl-prolyl cis-trans isomerase D